MAIEWLMKDYYKADAETVYKEITSIGEDFSPEQIVAKAKDPKTELHKCFEWDDKVAAQLYRLETARQIVRFLVIKKDNQEDDGNDRPSHIRACVSKNDKSGRFEPINVVVRNQDKYEKLLAQALSELEQFKRKYSTIKELDVILKVIDELLVA